MIVILYNLHSNFNFKIVLNSPTNNDGEIKGWKSDGDKYFPVYSILFYHDDAIYNITGARPISMIIYMVKCISVNLSY